jgi:hypothetical protein
MHHDRDQVGHLRSDHEPPMHNEALVLAALMDRSRQQVSACLQRLEAANLHHRHEVDGRQLNSAYWIAAHLAVSQNWLILRGTGGLFQKFSWAKHFSLGAIPLPPSECPPYEEVKATLEGVHRLAMEHVAGLGEAALDQAHQAMLQLPGTNDVRAVIAHHILHEASHAGQLSWLCKLGGLPTI